MANWKKYFIISGCSHFVIPGIGEFNAGAEHISEDKLLAAYKAKCPYVGLTDEGIAKYEPEKKPIKVNLIDKSKIEENPLKLKKNLINPIKPQ